MSYTLSQDEVYALNAFAKVNGKCWKAILTEKYWPNARIWEDLEGNKNLGYILHGIRNEAGGLEAVKKFKAS